MYKPYLPSILLWLFS